jgi:hypothetical protein
VGIEYDRDKVDEMVLALLWLTAFDQGEFGARAWKSHDWGALDRLHAKGYRRNRSGNSCMAILIHFRRFRPATCEPSRQKAMGYGRSAHRSCACISPLRTVSSRVDRSGTRRDLDLGMCSGRGTLWNSFLLNHIADRGIAP